MSSTRRIRSSRANGALSRGPITPLGKQHSSQNALSHGLFADCVVLENESREAFEKLLEQHLDHFRPLNGVEVALIEEMTAVYWRMRRAWALETRIFENQTSTQPECGQPNRMAAALAGPAGGLPSLPLVHRYEAKLHQMYHRTLRDLTMVRNAGKTSEPNPTSEHQAAPSAHA